MLKIGGIGITSNAGAGRHTTRLAGGRITLPGWLFYPFVAVLSLWLFAYVSGLVPYLGFKSGGFKSGAAAIGTVQYGTGDNDHLQTHRVFLFSGQTLIVDYDAQVRKGQLKIDVREGLQTFGPVLVQHSVTATGTGRVAAAVPGTGIYTIMFRPTYRVDTPRIETDVDYRLWWGGLFGG